MTEDIDRQYALNRVVIKNAKKEHQRQRKATRDLAEGDEDTESVLSADTSSQLSLPLGRLSRPAARSSPHKGFLDYELPHDLKQGATFTLWPPRTHSVSTALRLHDRSLAGDRSLSDIPFETRWEQSKTQPE